MANTCEIEGKQKYILAIRVISFRIICQMFKMNYIVYTCAKNIPVLYDNFNMKL